MKQFLILFFFLFPLSVSAQDVIVTRPKRQHNNSLTVSPPAQYLNGHGYVDLGLPSGTLWATCNVGASSPEGYGDYFAWGETKPRKGYHDWDQYKYQQITQWDGYKYVRIGGKGEKEHALTKYDTEGKYGGCKDNKTILEPSDDAATSNWGNEWQMPTREQVLELKQSSKIAWVKINGVYGYKVTSKTNGNSIFLPASGILEKDYSWDGSGCYWTRSLGKNSEEASTLRFHINMFDPTPGWRFLGASVRAVAKRKVLR